MGIWLLSCFSERLFVKVRAEPVHMDRSLVLVDKQKCVVLQTL